MWELAYCIHVYSRIVHLQKGEGERSTMFRCNEPHLPWRGWSHIYADFPTLGSPSLESMRTAANMSLWSHRLLDLYLEIMIFYKSAFIIVYFHGLSCLRSLILYILMLWEEWIGLRWTVDGQATVLVQTREMIIKIKLLAVQMERSRWIWVWRLGSQDWMKLGEKGGIKGGT